MNVRSEPGAVHRRVDTLRIARILRYVIDFPTAKIGALDVPTAAVGGTKDEGAFARPDPNGYRGCALHLLLFLLFAGTRGSCGGDDLFSLKRREVIVGIELPAEGGAPRRECGE